MNVKRRKNGISKREIIFVFGICYLYKIGLLYIIMNKEEWALTTVKLLQEMLMMNNQIKQAN